MYAIHLVAIGSSPHWKWELNTFIIYIWGFKPMCIYWWVNTTGLASVLTDFTSFAGINMHFFIYLSLYYYKWTVLLQRTKNFLMKLKSGTWTSQVHTPQCQLHGLQCNCSQTFLACSSWYCNQYIYAQNYTPDYNLELQTPELYFQGTRDNTVITLVFQEIPPFILCFQQMFHIACTNALP